MKRFLLKLTSETQNRHCALLINNPNKSLLEYHLNQI